MGYVPSSGRGSGFRCRRPSLGGSVSSGFPHLIGTPSPEEGPPHPDSSTSYLNTGPMGETQTCPPGGHDSTPSTATAELPLLARVGSTLGPDAAPFPSGEGVQAATCLQVGHTEAFPSRSEENFRRDGICSASGFTRNHLVSSPLTGLRMCDKHVLPPSMPPLTGEAAVCAVARLWHVLPGDATRCTPQKPSQMPRDAPLRAETHAFGDRRPQQVGSQLEPAAEAAQSQGEKQEWPL